MKMLFATALTVCALCGTALAQTPVAKNGKLSVQNGQIVNKDGKPVALRGMSFFWNQWQEGSKYYTSGVTGWLASDWKVDIVRLAINPGNSGDNDNWKTVASAAIENGIYVILDWHTEGQSDESAARSFFQRQANAYKNTPNVIFEIWNEPTTQTWATIKSYATNVVSTIRGEGADNIIIIGSRDYSKRVDEAAASPVSGTNLAYSVHYYTAEPGTQNQSDLRTWANVALNAGLALFVTEFGISESDGGGKNPSKIDTVEANKWFEYLDKNSIGWANWSICDKNEAASALNGTQSTTGNWPISGLSASGRFIRQKLVDYRTKTYSVTVTKDGQGNVTSDPPGPSYPHGSMVTLTAVGEPGWVFERWGGTDGSNLGTRNPGTFTTPLYSNKSVVAIFGQGSMIKNGTFTSNYNDWQSSGISLAIEDGTLKATVTGTTAFVRQSGLNLEKNKKYALSFRAKSASGSAAVTPRITNSGGTSYWEGDAVALTSAWKAANFEFCMGASDANAQIRFQTNNASGSVWNIDDIKLDESGVCQGGPPDTTKPPAAVLTPGVKAHKASWSVSRSGGALQLRGAAEQGARVSLYDVRGKVVKSMAAADGLTLGAGIPAGSYFVVVRDRAGGEVLRTRVVLAR